MREIKDIFHMSNFISFLKGYGISYAIFLIYVITYNYFNLHIGYAAHMDEGYLYSLASRIVDGQIPYKDFYFLRTPLSIYIHATYLYFLGDSYTIYIARIFYVLQISTLIILVSDIYRKYINKTELVFLLIISYTIVTLNIDFPWYSYDGLFFAGFSLFLLNRKRYLLCGITLFLAGMSKQNYFILFPVVLLVYQFFISHRKGLAKFRDISFLRTIIGFALTGSVFALIFIIIGNFEQFITQAFLLPKSISKISFVFTFFQNNGEALLSSLAGIIITIILYYYNNNRLISICVVAILISLIGINVSYDFKFYTFNIVFMNYTIMILFCYNNRLYAPSTLKLLKENYLIIIFIQYLSGFNYGGIFFANMGAGLVLPFSYLIFKRNKSNYLIAIILFLSVGIIGVKHKATFLYQESVHELITASFKNDKLKTIESTERQVNRVDNMVELIEINTNPNDYIFLFPNYSSLYYLSNRKNPTKTDWYYKLEYNHEMLIEAVADLESNKPKIIFIDNPKTPVELQKFIDENYYQSTKIDYIDVYLLK